MLNFDRVVSKLTNILNIWNNRHIIYARKEVIQTLGLSQIYYVSNVLDPPIKDINQIKQLIIDFIWNGRRYKVKYKSLTDEYNNTGIKLPDIETKVKTQRIICIKKLINSDYRKWMIIPYYYLHKVIGNNNIRTIFCCCLPCKMVPFYKNAFKVWSNFFSCKPVTPEEVLVQSL